MSSLRNVLLLAAVATVSACSHQSGTAPSSESAHAMTHAVPLFNGVDTAGWHNYRHPGTPANWKVVNGLLTNTDKGGDLITDGSYDNYVLELDFKLPPGGNSGILYRVTEEGAVSWHTGPEYQLYDHPQSNGLEHNDCAAVYDIYGPSVDVRKPAGEWNKAKIVVDHNHVEHWLNGTKVAQYDLDSADYKERFAKSKFKAYPNWGLPEKRQIALQGDHAPNIQFRNIRLTELPAK